MATNYSGSKEEILALNTFIKIIRCAETISSKNSANLNKKGLTESQFGILDAIFHLGPLKQKTLGEKILKSGGNITHVVDNLEKQKLVIRKRDEEDRRQYEIHMTKKGLKVFEKILPGQVKLIKNQMSVLSKEELETLGRLCRKVGLENNC
jgi:MarR family 2-MHQ and catechol resistance regulon transcriptional repressor